MTDSNSNVMDTGQPTPPVQTQTSVQQNSPSVDDLVAKIVDKLRPELETIAERKAQSVKDKRINAIEKQNTELEGFRKILAEANELKAQGLTDSQVEDKMLMRRVLEALQPAATPAPGQAQPVAEDHARKILSEAGINESDPEVVELARRQYASEADRVAAYATFVIRQVNKPQPNPAQIVQTAPANIPVVDLEAAYNREILAAQGNYREIVRIKQEYRQKGLKIP